MRFTKPAWLTHGGEKRDHEVYACHVSPDGTRLATAGGDGHVRIWSTDAIVNASTPAHTAPRQLASLSVHSGTIHSVRFSPNGKYLASGADDKIVCVYKLEPGEPAQTFGSKEAPAVENWRTYRRLFGHDNDVQDLGWSADSSMLVSVGLDSKVVVWSGYSFERLKTLFFHASHVKGITFDAANKYFATASDDRSMKIYRFTPPAPNSTAIEWMDSITLEATITTPFTDSPLTTYFRRCSWSPDGNHIAAANSVNGPVSSVAIIDRGTWNSDINFIGHEGPVEVCAFSPALFCREPPPPMREAKDLPVSVTVVACAGQDKTLSLWNTSQSKPFLTTQELSAKSISDLAWTPDGETLFFTSLDGTIGALKFEKSELGYPAPKADYEKALAKFGAGRKVGLAENTDALHLEEGSKAGELKGVEGRMGELMGNESNGPMTNGDTHVSNGEEDSTNASATDKTNGVPPVPEPVKDPQAERVDRLKQRVTITKDGKKRVAPLLLSTSNQGESNMPRPQLQAMRQNAGFSDEPAKILDLSKPYDGLPKGGLASLLLGNKRKFAEMAGADGEERPYENRVQAVQQTGAVPVLANTEDGLAPASSALVPKRPIDVPETLRPAVVDPSLVTSQIRLAVPMVRSVILRPLDSSKPAGDSSELQASNADGAGSDATIVFEARNAFGPSRTGRGQDRDPTRVSLARKGQTIWQDFLPRAVLLVTGNRNFWAAGCEDGSLHIWTPAGRRLLNASLLSAQPVILDARGWWLLAISAAGQCYVWNIQTMTAAHPPISLAPVLDAASQTQQAHLTASHALMFARLNSQGRIIVGMSNGDGYAYNPSMYIWQRLSEAWWAVGSQYWNTADTGATSISTVASSSSKTLAPSSIDQDDLFPENLVSSGILPFLERNTTAQALLRGRAFHLQRLVKQLLSAEGFEALESAVSVAHLENRLAGARLLGARDEFRAYLIMYAKRLGAEGLKTKVEELLRGLFGKMFEDDEGEDGDTPDGVHWGLEDDSGDEIVGWRREELLKEVVTVLGKHRDLQRITVPYARALGIASSALVVSNGESEGGGEMEE